MPLVERRGSNSSSQSEPFLQTAATLNTDKDVALAKHQAWAVYLSHFLSMWNSRTYEYGVVRCFVACGFITNFYRSSFSKRPFLSNANRGSGIAETVCVLVSSSALGHWIDHETSRLRPLLLSIITNRLTLVACCVLWVILFIISDTAPRLVLFAVILVLGMVEKASRMGNTLSMERDWVPTIADPEGSGGYSLTHLNTVMRRIDIGCKFLAPLVISAVVGVVQPQPAAAAVGVFSAVSLAVEIWTALRVWERNRRLQAPKQIAEEPALEMDNLGATNEVAPRPTSSLKSSLHPLNGRLRNFVLVHRDGIRYYFSTSVWLPSIGIAILHGSVLAWSGTLITWLLNAGVSLAEVTVAKGIGSVFEISSTILFPWAVGSILAQHSKSKTFTQYQRVQRDEDGRASDGEDAPDGSRDDIHDPTPSVRDYSLHVAVVHVARWAIIGLGAILAPTLFSLFYLDASMPHGASDTPSSRVPSVAAIAFFTFLSISFLGRWTYDLAVTQLTLMFVPASHRSSFGGTEMALVSCVSLVHWTAAAVWHEQDDFKWLALGSFIAVGMATIGYVHWSSSWARRTSN